MTLGVDGCPSNRHAMTLGVVHFILPTSCFRLRSARTAGAEPPPTSLHGATGAVGCFRHHLDNQGDSTLRLLSQPAWNDAGCGVLSTSFRQPRRFHATGASTLHGMTLGANASSFIYCTTTTAYGIISKRGPVAQWIEH